jgi:hypothetical protein
VRIQEIQHVLKNRILASNVVVSNVLGGIDDDRLRPNISFSSVDLELGTRSVTNRALDLEPAGHVVDIVAIADAIQLQVIVLYVVLSRKPMRVHVNSARVTSDLETFGAVDMISRNVDENGCSDIVNVLIHLNSGPINGS